MIYKEFGRTGVSVAEVGLGTYLYTGGPGPLRRGLESGALFIDTAEMYGTEPEVGEAVRGMRDRVFLATKVSPEHFRPDDVRRALDASLQKLGVDQVDLYQLHFPNPQVPIADTMGALARLVDAGKIRFCGVSNFSVAQLREAQNALGKHPVVSNQVRYNVIDRTIEADVLPYCQENGIAIIAYSPLSKSLSRILDCDPTGVLTELARETGKTAAQIAINWCLCQEGVFAIPKANSVEHILENCAASDWRLTGEQLGRLDARIQHRRRNRLDQMLRQWMPGPLQRMAKSAVGHLPRSLRRRFF